LLIALGGGVDGRRVQLPSVGLRAAAFARQPDGELFDTAVRASPVLASLLAVPLAAAVACLLG
jgi:hypothetical protein